MTLLAISFIYTLSLLGSIVEITQEISLQNATDVFTNEQLKYTETLTGAKQEPISFIILASNDKELVVAFEKSG